MKTNTYNSALRALLLITATIMLSSAFAQLKQSEVTSVPVRPQMQLKKPEAKMEVAQIRFPGTPAIKKGPSKTPNHNIWYRRPAGAFPASIIVKHGAYAGVLYAPYIAVTPYVDYTFTGMSEYDYLDDAYEWDVQYGGSVINSQGNHDGVWETLDGQNVTMQYGFETNDAPIINVESPEYYYFQLKGYEMGGTSEAPYIIQEYAQTILSVPSPMEIWNQDFLKSSKNFAYGGLYGDNRYLFTYYIGAQPYGNNEYGYHFGKNGGYHDLRIDGIGQAFEQPTAPYLLKNVVLYCAVLDVTAPLDMTCRIYKLDEIPCYDEMESVVLPEEPGELIAKGRATLTPETNETTGGLVFFDLYGEKNGIEHKVTPTIDCPILVVIDGYNEPEMANLIDFSALICSDDEWDEGFGELAYLKVAYPDEHGNHGPYYWTGLNNFFMSGQMKTGFSIFLSTENPFLKFNSDNENGRYLFPHEGGQLIKTDNNISSTGGIQFLSWVPSCNGDWKMTWDEKDALPDWLNFELDDIENLEHGTIVNAEVTADPLPEGVTGRKAIVRFSIPGNYIDYLFMQGDVDPDMPLDAMYDFVEDGIYYTVTGQYEVSVTCRDKKYNTYSGSIVIPEEVTHDGVTYAVTGIAANAFRGCSNMSTLTIPVSVISIADNAFYQCYVNEVCITGNGSWLAGELPSTVKTLYVCSGVTSIAGLNTNPSTIYSYSTVPPICNDLTFTGYDGILHIPAASVASYFIADYWCNFANIVGDAVEPLAIAMSQDSINLILNQQESLNATIHPTNATPNTISWHSSNKAIATVNNGMVKAIAKGECDIIATCVGKQTICHVTVTEILPTSLTISQKSATLEVDEQISLTATVLPENATNATVQWSSTDNGVAIVNNGSITAIAPGECDIIARCRNLSDTCHVIVVDKIIYITLDKHEVSVLPNHIISLIPSMTPEQTSLKVTSSNPTVAAARLVSSTVQVVGIKEGMATIFVGSVDGTAVSDSCLVTVYTERGDVNCDGFVNISDVTSLVNRLLTGQSANISEVNADTNNDGQLNIADVTRLINHLLSGNALDPKEDPDSDGHSFTSSVPTVALSPWERHPSKALSAPWIE